MIANTEGGVHRLIAHGPHGRRPADAAAPPVSPTALDAALDATRGWLLDQQRPDGHWVGELEGDTILESEYILLMAYLGRENEPLCGRLCKYLHDQQLPDGGWTAYPGGPIEISASVKAYFALKLCGMHPDHPAMVKARAAIRSHGGAGQCNSFTRFYLALLGQISYDECPSVPTELTFIPSWLGFSLYAMSSWTRTIVVPLSILSARKPVRRIEPDRGIAELYLPGQGASPKHETAPLSWSRFFLALDRLFKWADRSLPTSWRSPGLRAAHRWMLEHFEGSDGLGAIFPPMVYTVLSLECLGYSRDSAPYRWALQQLEDLIIDDGESARIQPCVSPVWDTAIATIALADAGLPDFHPALLRSARWMLEREVRSPGDWAKRRPKVEPAGWHFQYRNELYPDIDDTAMVLLALGRTSLDDSPEVQPARARAIAWLLAMQNRDGGWAAFDVDIDNEVLTKVPFADHNAMLDPSCADITARILEILGRHGYRSDHPAIARALDYLWKSQEAEGCWYGRWGVNYIYGTWQVLLGLRAIDAPMNHPAVIRAMDWLESVQQSCGGWGETCASYDDPSLKGQGAPTASQTAWAVLGLIAGGRDGSAAVRRGITHLVETQNADGTWDEAEFTGTGFPRVFYLKYHLYRIYFPLMALGRYRVAAARLPQPSSPAAMASRIPAHPLSHEV